MFDRNGHRRSATVGQFVLLLIMITLLCMVAALLFVLARPAKASAAGASKVVYLTFDDGPGIYTEGVLKTLAVYQAKATFFYIGQHMEERPDLTKKVSAAGHELGNHTYDHPHLADLDEKGVKAELSRTQAIMKSLGVASNCFRPPFFSTSPSVEQWGKELGLRQVMYQWDMTQGPDVTIGAAGESNSAVVARNVLSTVFDGAIVTLHAENGGNAGQYGALPAILRGLRDRGYTMKALPYCNRTVTRIMPLGDSITAGVGQDDPSLGGYRGRLDALLRRGAVPSGFTYRWVGDQETLNHVGLAHSGHGGWTIDQIYEKVTSWQKAYRPDVILLHIGTNNISKGDSAGTTNRKLAKLLKRIRENQPRVRVFVARIIDVSALVPIAEQKTNAVYSWGELAVTQAAGARFYTVDMRRIGGESLFDYHHPNRFGYSQMAYLWYEALRGILPYSLAWRGVSNPFRWTHAVICHYDYTLRTRVCADQPVNDGKG